MIGVFDSGIGGLTAVKALESFCPERDIVYFGDTARVPYGVRTKETIEKYALQDCEFLLSLGVNYILVACGTVSSNALDVLRGKFSLPIFGVVEGAAEKAREAALAGNGIAAVLGTKATVESLAFEKEIAAKGGGVTVVAQACPLLVPLVENGRTSAGDRLANIAVGEYLSDIIPLNPAAVILGCTHYPLLFEVFTKFLPDSLLINASEEAARKLCGFISKNEKSFAREGKKAGKRSFYVSDDPASFAKNAFAFLGRDISKHVTKVNIDI